MSGLKSITMRLNESHRTRLDESSSFFHNFPKQYFGSGKKHYSKGQLSFHFSVLPTLALGSVT